MLLLSVHCIPFKLLLIGPYLWLHVEHFTSLTITWSQMCCVSSLPVCFLRSLVELL